MTLETQRRPEDGRLVHVPADDASSSTAGGAPQLAAGAMLAVASMLAGCGSGGGDEPAPIAAAPGPSPAPGPAAGPAPAAAQSRPAGVEQAVRFLTQAQFAASDADIARVTAIGYSAWLDEQFAQPLSGSHWDWLLANYYANLADPTQFRNQQTGMDNTVWRKLVAAPDQVRQRIVLALSEIFVVSVLGVPVSWRQFIVGNYLDVLEANAFGTFRELIGAITLSSGMGVYLNMRGNQREDPATGRVPDENYAREILQLFTIGLYELDADGTQRRDARGAPIESYTQADITGLARVFTGWDFSTTGAADATSPERKRNPMVHNAGRFSTGEKRFLGTTIPASAGGPQALGLALDAICAHPNVGPFIGRQLIQRLVTSNPSPAYVGRVAAAFANNGQGVRGDLRAVYKAVLLDPEVRTAAPNAAPTWGKVREPIVRFVQWARQFNAQSPTGVWNIGDTSDPSTRLGQSPLRSPSVFNFFRPGYVPPNTALGASGLVAPELQITNESTVIGYANFMQARIQSGIGEVRADYSGERALANDARGLVDRLVERLAAGQVGEDTRRNIAAAVGSIAATTDAGRLNRVYAAVLLVMCSPEYIVQK